MFWPYFGLVQGVQGCTTWLMHNVSYNIGHFTNIFQHLNFSISHSLSSMKIKSFSGEAGACMPASDDRES